MNLQKDNLYNVDEEHGGFSDRIFEMEMRHKMVLAEEIGYECEIQENISVEDIRKEYDDGIIVWINGSGTSPEGKPGAYRCVLDYKGHAKYIEKELSGATANQAMLMGAIDAVMCVNKSLRLYLISPIALGFVNGFKGKGVNGNLIQQLCECIKDKGCLVTEVQFINGGNTIKKFVYSCNPNKEKVALYNKMLVDKKNRYKEIVYGECLVQVEQILVRNGIDDKIIKEIRQIKPSHN